MKMILINDDLKNNQDKCLNKGFTVIELLIVIAIIGVLVGIGISQYANTTGDAKKKRAMSDIKTICDSIRNYNRVELKKFYKVQDLSQLTGKYLQKLPKDPWDRPYKVDGTYVYSFGEDGFKSLDDIKMKYERDSIVENPTFVATQDSYGNEKPGAWKMNPESSPQNAGNTQNVVGIDKDNSTSGGNVIVIK